MMEFKFNEVHGKFEDYERRQINEHIKENHDTLVRILSEMDMKIEQIHISDGNEPIGEILPMNFKEYALTRVSDDVVEIEKIKE